MTSSLLSALPQCYSHKSWHLFIKDTSFVLALASLATLTKLLTIKAGIIFISLWMVLNSCHCHWWLPPVYVIFWIHLHRCISCKERDNIEYCPSVLVCGLEGAWVSKALLFSCHACIYAFHQDLLFFGIDEASKSNSFVCGNLNQHSREATATAERVAQRQRNHVKAPLGILVLLHSLIFPNTSPPQHCLHGWEMAHPL